MESHNHWAVGHVDGFCIRVYRDGEITEAFKTYHDLIGATGRLPDPRRRGLLRTESMKRPSKTSMTPHGG